MATACGCDRITASDCTAQAFECFCACHVRSGTLTTIGGIVPAIEAELAQVKRERDEARAALAVLEVVRQHGCDCADDEACLFVREREDARTALARAETFAWCAIVARDEAEQSREWWADECERLREALQAIADGTVTADVDCWIKRGDLVVDAARAALGVKP